MSNTARRSQTASTQSDNHGNILLATSELLFVPMAVKLTMNEPAFMAVQQEPSGLVVWCNTVTNVPFPGALMEGVQRGLWSVTMNTRLCAPPAKKFQHVPFSPYRVVGFDTKTQRWGLHNLLPGNPIDLNEEKLPRMREPFEVGIMHF